MPAGAEAPVPRARAATSPTRTIRPGCPLASSPTTTEPIRILRPRRLYLDYAVEEEAHSQLRNWRVSILRSRAEYLGTLQAVDRRPGRGGGVSVSARLAAGELLFQLHLF